RPPQSEDRSCARGIQAMTTPTDAQLAELVTRLRERKRSWIEAIEVMEAAARAVESLAASRLSSREEITEAKVQRACNAYSGHPDGDAAHSAAMRAALEAVREG